MVTHVYYIHRCYLQDDPLLSDRTTDCVMLTPPLMDYVMTCARVFVTNKKLHYISGRTITFIIIIVAIIDDIKI